MTKIRIENLECKCAAFNGTDRIAYVLYPMNILDGWITQAATRHQTNIVVITGMDWQNVFSPWGAKGVPRGTPDFKGESGQFLSLLRERVVPRVEHTLSIDRSKAERTLFGVSMSGLFALWQWMVCDEFVNIASLSGSFWYEGFIEWFERQPLPRKSGKAFFLLGEKESRSPVKAFNTVEANTKRIVDRLQNGGIDTTYIRVAGNHYAFPVERLEEAFSSIYD
ncbi:MAG: alpha/beta hydrolase-fold protein [Bacteroides sp.]|nr:alpha/beta hydrolase-fold protein [Bacteroides sp.]MCM1413209.1 alpha/beta hydrolase-fold protein [Bacteroides sp.]MCM1472049.1 alpha/beta hydrolase-fold protein [Bacteroides sp.]